MITLLPISQILPFILLQNIWSCCINHTKAQSFVQTGLKNFCDVFEKCNKFIGTNKKSRNPDQIKLLKYTRRCKFQDFQCLPAFIQYQWIHACVFLEQISISTWIVLINISIVLFLIFYVGTGSFCEFRLISLISEIKEN